MSWQRELEVTGILHKPIHSITTRQHLAVYCAADKTTCPNHRVTTLPLQRSTTPHSIHAQLLGHATPSNVGERL